MANIYAFFVYELKVVNLNDVTDVRVRKINSEEDESGCLCYL